MLIIQYCGWNFNPVVLVFKHSSKFPKLNDLPTKIPVGNLDDASYTKNKNNQTIKTNNVKTNNN